MTTQEKSAIAILKSSHHRIEDLLAKYKNSLSAADKEKLLADISFELSVLAVLEIDVFYPALANAERAFNLDEFLESHDNIKIAMAQIQRLLGEEPEFDPHMKELCNLVNDHITKEETELFAKLKDCSLDLDAIGDGLYARSKEFSSRLDRQSADLGFTI